MNINKAIEKFNDLKNTSFTKEDLSPNGISSLTDQLWFRLFCIENDVDHYGFTELRSLEVLYKQGKSIVDHERRVYTDPDFLELTKTDELLKSHLRQFMAIRFATSEVEKYLVSIGYIKQRMEWDNINL